MSKILQAQMWQRGREIIENSQTEAEKREETSVKPGERLTTARAAVAKPDGFQNINGGTSWNDKALDVKTRFFIVTS